MAITKYQYTISTQTLNGAVDLTQLGVEVEINTAIGVVVDNMNCIVADKLDIYMVDALTAPQEAALTATVAAHRGIFLNIEPLPPAPASSVAIPATCDVEIFRLETSGGDILQPLPVAATYKGNSRRFSIREEGNGYNVLTIAPQGTDTLNGGVGVQTFVVPYNGIVTLITDLVGDWKIESVQGAPQTRPQWTNWNEYSMVVEDGIVASFQRWKILFWEVCHGHSGWLGEASYGGLGNAYKSGLWFPAGAAAADDAAIQVDGLNAVTWKKGTLRAEHEGPINAPGGFRRSFESYLALPAAATTYTCKRDGSLAGVDSIGWVVPARAGSLVELSVWADAAIAAGDCTFWVQKSVDGGAVWTDLWGTAAAPVLTLDSVTKVTANTLAWKTSEFAAGDLLRVRAATGVGFSANRTLCATLSIEC